MATPPSSAAHWMEFAAAHDLLMARVSCPGPRGTQLADVLLGGVRELRPRLLAARDQLLDPLEPLRDRLGFLYQLAGGQRLGFFRALLPPGAAASGPGGICPVPTAYGARCAKC